MHGTDARAEERTWKLNSPDSILFWCWHLNIWSAASRGTRSWVGVCWGGREREGGGHWLVCFLQWRHCEDNSSESNGWHVLLCECAMNACCECLTQWHRNQKSSNHLFYCVVGQNWIIEIRYINVREYSYVHNSLSHTHYHSHIYTFIQAHKQYKLSPGE